MDLEKQLETPSEDGRIRVLKGDDPKPDELTAKVEEVIYPVRVEVKGNNNGEIANLKLNNGNIAELTHACSRSKKRLYTLRSDIDP